MLPSVGPTPAAAGLAPVSNDHVPAKAETGTFAKLNVHQTPGAVSRVTLI